MKENGIGLCVDSLARLGETLSEVTPEDYDRMQKNIRRVSQRLSEGYYFTTAVTTAIGYFELDNRI